MLDVRPDQIWANAATPVEMTQTLTPQVLIRPATADERTMSNAWFSLVEDGVTPPEVIEYADGSMTHAPETIAEYHAQAALLPDDFTLIYLHRGAQAQCVNPLLPSLLYLTGHKGPSHTLRRSGDTGLTLDVHRFAHAMTPTGSAALIVDDRQLRLARAGRITPACVHFYLLTKSGVLPRKLQGAHQ